MLHRTTRSAWHLVIAFALAACSRAPVTTPAPSDARHALRSAIDSMVDAPEFRNAHWGVLIVDPERGDTLYSRNAGKLFMPASNQKIITGAVALATLGADYRYRTPVAVGAGPRTEGIAPGDLVVFGSGDPSISDAMRGDAFVFLQSFADSLRARGIEGFAGRVRSGRDAFPDAPLGFGWAWDDLDYPYSAGADELMLNEGFSTVVIRGNERAGLPALAQTKSMGGPGVRIEATTVAKAQGAPTVNRIQVTTAPELASPELHNVVIVRGTIAVADSIVEEVAHRDVSGAFIDALRVALSTRTVSQLQKPADEGARLDTLFTIVSPPFRDILKRMEKPSQNQIAEVLYKTIALEKTGVGTADSARAVVERQLVAWGARPDGFAVRDGSGLSRHDYVTPETLVRVLDAMRRHADFPVFYDALPIAGVDGTIRNRMKGTPAEGNVHAKTGFVDKARSLSGYVTTADGRMLIFSVLANNWTTPTRAVERVQDAIAARLASMRLAR